MIYYDTVEYDTVYMISYFWKWREWWYEVTDKQEQNFNITNAQTGYTIYITFAIVLQAFTF
jgi:hypothetical protein